MLRTAAMLLLLLIVGVTLFPEDPSSNRTTINKEVRYLEELRFKGPGKVIITQGEHSALEIEGDKEILFDTKIKLARGVLEITRKGNLFQPPTEQFICKITVDNDFNKLILEGSAHLQTELLKLQDLHVSVHDTANAELLLQGDDLLSQVFDKGKLAVRGKVDTQKVLLKDQAIYQAPNLVSRTAAVKVVGEGEAIVQADDALTLFVVGDGKIFYTKEPKELSKKISGSGQISSK